MSDDKIMLFIPAYNCEVQLPRVIAKIDQSIQDHVEEVVVIENRSSDRTLDVAIEAIAGLAVKATVLQNVENYSLGGSIKKALLYAEEHKYTYLIVLHGDDQADIRDLLPILDAQAHLQNDIVIGARFHPESRLEGYSGIRKAGNLVLNFAFGLVARRKVHDMIAGLNILRVDFFADRTFLNFPNNLTFDAHVLLYAFALKARILYVPVTWREEDQISNAKTVKQALTILRLLARYVFRGQKVFASNGSGRPRDFQYPSMTVYQTNVEGH